MLIQLVVLMNTSSRMRRATALLGPKRAQPCRIQLRFRKDNRGAATISQTRSCPPTTTISCETHRVRAPGAPAKNRIKRQGAPCSTPNRNEPSARCKLRRRPKTLDPRGLLSRCECVRPWGRKMTRDERTRNSIENRWASMESFVYDWFGGTKQNTVVCAGSNRWLVHTVGWQITASPASLATGFPLGPLTMISSGILTQSSSSQSRWPASSIGLPRRAHHSPLRSSASVVWQSSLLQQDVVPAKGDICGRWRLPYHWSKLGLL